MWLYEKKLQYPVQVMGKDIKMAKYLITQYGGPDGELLNSIVNHLSFRNPQFCNFLIYLF